MGIAWKDFEMPRKIAVEDSSYSDTYGKFTAEPFERGYGPTIGNSLRRVLVSSIEGWAVTSIKIDGVQHEFSTVPGVLEDVAEIVLNVKKIVLCSHAKGPKTLHIKTDKKGDIKAGDIVTDETVEVLNPDLHIATLTKNTPFSMQLEIGKGRGYVSAEKNKKENQSIGIIAVDSIFSPVKRVNFLVENTRVGQMTDYDKLILEIWTNGSMSPKDALLYASNILQRHLDVFVGYGKLPEEEVTQEVVIEDELIEKLKMPVSELELSVRSANCLREAHIKTIADMVKKTEAEMLKYRNFGKKSLTEIGVILKEMGLTLGMKLDKEVLKKLSS